jgi:hypothetical protein
LYTNSDFNRWVEPELSGQRGAELELVDHPGSRRNPVGPTDLVEPRRELPDRHLDGAAAHVPPGADQGREAGDGPDRLPAATAPFQRDALPDRGRLRGGVLPGELPDVSGRYAGDLRDPLGGVLRRPLGELGVPDGVLLDVVLVDQALLDDRADQAHGEGAVRARPDPDVPVGLTGGPGPHRVDDDDLRALLLRLEHERPRVEVRAGHVHAPHDDVARVRQALHIQAAGGADRHDPRRRRARFAVRLLRDARAEAVEERVTRGQAVEDALVTEVGVRHDRLWAVLGDDAVPAVPDLGQCVVPGDAGELARSLGSGAPHRVQQAVRLVVVLGEAPQLDAQTAPRHGMVGVAPDVDQPAALDVVQHRAGVGAVVRADTPDDRPGCLRVSFRYARHRTPPHGSGEVS